ncbi:MAG TPA: hypothetical protein VIG33_07205 [Pseudobdellovibrionaceae bacterium]
MFNNVIPIRKNDRFGVFLGSVTSSGEVVESTRVGTAYLKPGSKTFRLKLWVFPNNQYFVAPHDQDPTKYVVLSLDEFQTPQGEVRSFWNPIGEGRLVGSFIKLSIYLFSEDVFLCLFPENYEAKEDVIAS